MRLYNRTPTGSGPSPFRPPPNFCAKGSARAISYTAEAVTNRRKLHQAQSSLGSFSERHSAVTYVEEPS